MIEDAVLWEWLSFAVRWLHVITAIAWIGSSFYFIALDLGLRRGASQPGGVLGEEWQVHGDGFYHIQKYSVAPASLPDRLTWFKWESYATWLSGFALLIIVYYAGPTSTWWIRTCGTSGCRLPSRPRSRPWRFHGSSMTGSAARRSGTARASCRARRRS